MSDDTTKFEQSASQPRDTPSSPGASTSGERAGFCQDCGTPLSSSTARPVGSAIFCESCLTARVGATYSPHTTVPSSSVPSEPKPALAALLGFIPGVGAMYNGQFGKGVLHLIIFAVLVSLSDDVNGVFGVLVAGWVFYMVFEAYHTAVARRDGMPLPNPFGFNDIGERMGFGRPFTGASSQTPPINPATPPYTAPPSNSGPTQGTPGATVPNPTQTATASDWIGYVPPSAFAAPTPTNTAARRFVHTPASSASYTSDQVPYAETYIGTYATPDLAAESSANRFPSGALWLIGLGVLILIGNLLPDWKLTERWWPPLLFAALALWTLTRRMRSGVPIVCILRWPVLLMAIAIILALHAAYFNVTFGLTVSVLLILYGVLLLLERTVGTVSADLPPSSSPVNPPFDPQSEDSSARSSWTASSPASSKPVRPAPSDKSQDGF